MAFPLSYVNGKNIADILDGTNTLDLNAGTWQGALYDGTALAASGWDSAAAEAYGNTFWNTGDEVTSTGYTAKGFTIASPSITVSAGKFIWDSATQLSWTGVTFNADGLLVFDDAHASDLAVCALKFSSTASPVGDDLTVDFDPTNGIFYATFGTGS